VGTGDAAHIDADDYVWFSGRADEVLNIASHRLGTIEVERPIPNTRRWPKPG
jgi:acetyl-CoA synthetase